jgi:hypothetical protein
VTNNQNGEVTVRVHRIIEVGGGLNYIDTSGNWQESQDLIESTPDGGAAAVRCPNKVYLGATLDNTPEGTIKIVTRSNLVLNTYPIGVYYYEPDTGKEVLLAPLANAVSATLLPPNRVLYRSAFHSQLLEADLRITCTRAGIECDTVMTRQPKARPQDFGLNASRTLLQVRHAWSTTAVPALASKQIPAELGDTTIDFRDLLFAPGRAFAWDGTETDTNTLAQINVVPFGRDKTQVPVGKTWQSAQNGGPAILIESVRWLDVHQQLNHLPRMAALDLETSPDDPGSLLQPRSPPKPASAATKSLVRSSRDDTSPGFVLDYIAVAPSVDYTFETYVPGVGPTYFLTDNVILDGNITFLHHCVIKAGPSGSLSLAGGAVSFKGYCDRPSILTSQSDNMYGEEISQECASIPPAGNPALWIWYSLYDGLPVNWMDIRFAQAGVEFDGSSCTQTRSLNYSTIESCNVGIYANDCAVTIQESTTSSVTTPSVTLGCGSISGSWTNVCNQVSLESSVLSAMQGLQQGHTPQTGIPLYLRDANNYAVDYNTNCWVYGLKGLTSICVSNSLTNWHQGGSVLITSKHVLTAAHLLPLGFGPGMILRFIGKSGTTRQW